MKTIYNKIMWRLFGLMILMGSCSSTDESSAILGNPCELGEQGYYENFYDENQMAIVGVVFDDPNLVAQFITGGPYGDYYHIYSVNTPNFIDFYSYATTVGDVSDLGQTFNTTDGTYYAQNGTSYYSDNTIQFTTIQAGNQVGEGVQFEFAGTYLQEYGEPYYSVEGGFCVTIDEVITYSDYLYITDGTSLKVINVANPSSPSLVHTIPAASARYVKTINSVAYVGHFDVGAPFVSFVNVSNPPTAYVYETIDKGNSIGNYQRLSDVTEVENYTYVGDELGAFYVFQMATQNYSIGDLHNTLSMTLIGDNMTQVDWLGGLHKIDVTNPSQPYITNVFDTGLAVDINIYDDGNESFHSWVRDNETDLFVANIIDKKLKKFSENAFGYTVTNEVVIDGYTTAIDIQGNYAAISMKAGSQSPLLTSYDGIKIVDLVTMTVTDSKPLNNASGIIINAGYVYATDTNGLHIYAMDSNGILSPITSYNPGFGNYISL